MSHYDLQVSSIKAAITHDESVLDLDNRFKAASADVNMRRRVVTNVNHEAIAVNI